MIRLHPSVSDQLRRGDVPGVRGALQAAIELEHSVIPPYLYALYSLRPGANDAVAGILRSVVNEEMLHLALAANLLNAVGGRPALDSPRMLPRYPGPLPGTVDDGLVVGLAPFSVALFRDTFMRIEQPEQSLGFGEAGTAANDALTIGQFYRRIRAALVALGPAAFTGRPQHQVGPREMSGAFAVTGVDSACQAIDAIIDQGEGTVTSPLESAGADLAHYYRLAEVVHGRRLVARPGATPDTPPDQLYAYAGDPLPADEAEVFAVPANPSLAGYPAGSAARRSCAAFNFTYTRLLKTLHAAFNGSPGQLTPAVALMLTLRQQAQAMLSASVPAGPSFEWQPAAPEAAA